MLLEDRFCSSRKGWWVGVTQVTLHGGWQLLQLAGEMSWSALDGPFFFLAQTGAENTLGGFISGTVGSF